MRSPLVTKILLPFFTISVFVLPLQAQEITDKEQAKILWVVDGDTLKVDYKGQEETIRLIGIDAPESRINPKAKKDAERSEKDIETITALGKESTKFVESLVKQGDTVKIEFDVQTKDKYGRLLCYVYISEKMLNEEILEEGYANLMTVPPNVKYDKKFLEAYREARENKRGLWKE